MEMSGNGLRNGIVIVTSGPSYTWLSREMSLFSLFVRACLRVSVAAVWGMVAVSKLLTAEQW